MRDEAKERLELLSTIQDLGYESLRYSIFNDHRPSEWETRIEYNPELELYEVYSTMDRASTGSIFKFKTFENFEKSIREWFEKAECNLQSDKFKSNTQYDDFKNKLNRTKTKLQNAKEFLEEERKHR